MATEKIFICTNVERLGRVLAYVWRYLTDIELPSKEDPSYLLTIEVPTGEWENLRGKLVATTE